MNHKSKISVTQKQHTENGKLLKEQYVLCTPIHSTLIEKMINIAFQSVNRSRTERIKRMDCNVNYP
jgi:hypothetical protein